MSRMVRIFRTVSAAASCLICLLGIAVMFSAKSTWREWFVGAALVLLAVISLYAGVPHD